MHWSFFEGGNATGWLRHVPKETWADYVVYLNQFNGGFDGRGKPTLQPALPNRGDASLIHTAQEEFGRRKLSLDATKQVNLPPVETPAAIDRRIQAHGTDMRDEVARMSRRGFNSYLRIAKELGWSVNELEQRYKTTSRVVSTVYQSHP
ncbi:MAG: hypothetical protein HY048_11390 [Acidobacteria bacterium]|nr:hypothetical protein [Acidobacteriota bacterium]